MARTPTQVGPGDPLDDGRSGGRGGHGGSEHDARAAELLHLEYEQGLESDEGRWSDPREFESHLSERGESPSVEVWEVFKTFLSPMVRCPSI